MYSITSVHKVFKMPFTFLLRYKITRMPSFSFFIANFSTEKRLKQNEMVVDKSSLDNSYMFNFGRDAYAEMSDMQ